MQASQAKLEFLEQRIKELEGKSNESVNIHNISAENTLDQLNNSADDLDLERPYQENLYQANDQQT